MKLKFVFTIILSLYSIILLGQGSFLTKKHVKSDIEFLTKTLNESSSYVYLNGYDFNVDFEHFLANIEDSFKLEDFGLFLTRTLGKIGDRHLSLQGIRGFDLNETLFLPHVYAPLGDKVVVLKRMKGDLEILNPIFPYLTEIDGVKIADFLEKTRPEHKEAPAQSYFTRAVRDIRDIQKNYILLGKALPEKIKLTLADSSLENDTILVVPVIDRSKRERPWDEKFESEYVLVKDEDYNKLDIIEQLFNLQNDIAYVRLPAMVSTEEAPLLFDKLNSFMKAAQNESKALIIDVRSNNGGTRDIMYEFAKYLVHPDSIYVVNATRQRGPIPLPEDYKRGLTNRFLFPFDDLDTSEQDQVRRFLRKFQPMYALDNQKYSEYYYGIFNGKHLAEPSFYYNKPVYILANEKSFSAASVFVSAFKGLPNIKIVGITTDGSSGNSDWFDLPKTELFGKISTMVSFQKNGKILDGYGTQPDIKIERDINQILWKRDTQLEHLRSLIVEEISK